MHTKLLEWRSEDKPVGVLVAPSTRLVLSIESLLGLPGSTFYTMNCTYLFVSETGFHYVALAILELTE